MTASKEASLAAEQAPIWRRSLEAALADLPLLACGVDRAPLVARLERTLEILLRLDDERATDTERMRAAEAALVELAAFRRRIERAATPGPAGAAGAKAEGAEAGTAAIERHLDAVERALRRFRGAMIEALVKGAAPAEPPPATLPVDLRASSGVPALHALARSFLPPLVRVDPRPEAEEAAPWADPLAWRAFPTPGGRRGLASAEARAPLPESARSHVRALARDCIDDIGLLADLRRVESADLELFAPARSPLRPPGAAVRHAGIASVERRMLENLDALVALGTPWIDRAPGPPSRGVRMQLDVLAEVERHADDAFLPDPARAFARAFVLCCVEGTDAVDAAVSALRRSHPETFDAQRDALALASSPHVGPAMRHLAVEPSAALARVGLDVLRFRRECDFGTAALALRHPDPRVRASAALCLATVAERDSAVLLLERALVSEADGDAACCIAESLLRRNAATGLRFLRERLAEPAPESAPGAGPEAARRRRLVRLLAVAGDASDADTVGRAATDHPADIESIGWMGAASLVSPLLARAERLVSGSGSPPVRVHRAYERAFARITGSSAGAPAEPASAPQRSHDPRADVAAWKKHWAERGGDFTASRKYRAGKPYFPFAALDELEQDGASADDREACCLEMAILTAGASPLEPDDWAARQTRTIELLREHFAGPGRPRPGDFLARRAR